jgi:ATP-dependent Lhr-like helicase
MPLPGVAMKRFPGNYDDSVPLVRWMPDAWPIFFHRRRPRPIQIEAIPLILHGKNVLVTGPTASGKTEAAVAPLYQRHVSFHRRTLSVVYVAPTRALANDIFHRLSDYYGGPEGAGGILRYTGDHHGFHSPENAFLLVTTPEALDSLQLVRPESLFGVRAVVVDEVHFLHGNPRGQQLRAVLSRLERASTVPTNRKDHFQKVVMSATVDDVDALRRLWAGAEAETVMVFAPRKIELRMYRISSADSEAKILEETAQGIRKYLEDERLGKVLIFANSRNEAHKIAFALHNALAGTRWPVYLHFGILSASERERIEECMQTDPFGVCVATSTLEVGIDIGNIDSVILHSAPFNVNAFLQRIGRGNRRTGTCRVLAVCRNEEESRTYEALKTLAEEGHLDEVHEFHRPSVTFQQVLSLSWRGLRTEKPLKRSRIVSEGLDYSSDEVVEDMVGMGHLRIIDDFLIPSDELLDEGDARRIHSVIIGSPAHPVIDANTGDTVASFEYVTDEGDYFLDGSIRTITGTKEKGFVLERIKKGKGDLGRIPSISRKNVGSSRRLTWRIAELQNINPAIWIQTGGRIVTWGGINYNRVLAILLGKRGLMENSSVDYFSVGTLRSSAIVTPKQVLDWAIEEKTWQEMGMKELEPFRQASRYYNLLSPKMKRLEALQAIPRAGFIEWLRDCSH